MSLETKNWESGISFSDGDRKWSPLESDHRVLRSSSYADYTSPSRVTHLVDSLCELTGHNEVQILTTQGGATGRHHLSKGNLSQIGQILEPMGWGVVVITSCGGKLQSDDLVDVFALMGPEDFAIRIDFDDGLVAACPARCLGSLADH